MTKRQQTSIPVCAKQVEPLTSQNKRNMFYLLTTVTMLSSILMLIGFNVV